MPQLDLSVTSLRKYELFERISQDQMYWRNHPSVWLTCRQNKVLTEASQQEWIDKIHKDPTVQFFGIRVDNNGIVGTVGLTSINRDHRTAEFSLLIGPEHQGKGHSTPALLHLLSYGFQRLDLETIYGEAICNNTKALGCYEKLGFQHEGLLRSRYYKMGVRYDSVVFSMLKEEFEKLYGPLMREVCAF